LRGRQVNPRPRNSCPPDEQSRKPEKTKTRKKRGGERFLDDDTLYDERGKLKFTGCTPFPFSGFHLFGVS
jgi:hypothetical protein